MSEAEELVRSMYRAATERDVDAWLAHLTEDVEIHELASMPDTEVYRGHEGARRWLAGVLELVDEWEWLPDEVIHEEPGRLIMRTRFVARSRGGVPVDQIVFQVFDIEDGKLARARGYTEAEEALAAAGVAE
jgi:ketosteroid isomerase-like protein